MAMTDDFSKYPPTIGEIRSDKSRRADDWSPRDALIAALRDIDSGVYSPTSCVICFGNVRPDGGTQTNIYQSTANRYEFLGLLEAVKGERWKADITG